MGTPGNNLHEVETAEGTRFLASMPPRFRRHIWIKRGDSATATVSPCHHRPGTATVSPCHCQLSPCHCHPCHCSCVTVPLSPCHCVFVTVSRPLCHPDTVLGCCHLSPCLRDCVTVTLSLCHCHRVTRTLSWALSPCIVTLALPPAYCHLVIVTRAASPVGVPVGVTRTLSWVIVTLPSPCPPGDP